MADAAAPPPSASSTPVASAPPPSPPKACRIMASENGLPPSADPTAWVDLPDKSTTTVRVIDSGREIRFEGAGRARPCAGELSILVGGGAGVAPGTGDAPGAEAWIATPCGTMRFTAMQKVVVEGDVCRVTASAGSAYVHPAHDARVSSDAGAVASSSDGWIRVEAPRTIELRVPRSGKRLAAAMERCTHVVADASDIAARLLDGGPSPSLAAQSVLARRAARAACATAQAIAGALGDEAAERAAKAAFEPLR